jgi:hypothetical protein
LSITYVHEKSNSLASGLLGTPPPAGGSWFGAGIDSGELASAALKYR